MPKTSRDAVSEVVDHGPVEDRTEHFDGYTVNFVTIKQDSDLTPLLKGLPDDSCQCPHWGYMFAGSMTVRYGEQVETVEAGEAFYLPPGHVPMAVAGTDFVQFSPAEELRISEAAMARNMQALMDGS